MLFKVIAILFAFLIFANHVYAQEQGGWIQTPVRSTYISDIEVTPFGIFASEYANVPKTTNKPYNGVFVSKDLGETWQKTGLEDKGVSDLAFSNGNIWAATYFNNSSDPNYLKNGIYVSKDKGETWEHKGEVFSTFTVGAYKDTILAGGASHGLWISFDNGETWEQKIGSGWFGPDIDSIFTSENLFLVYADWETYKSTDGGHTWTTCEGLRRKYIRNFTKGNDIILAGTANKEGMYRSTDNGETWEKVPAWIDDGITSAITYFWFNQKFYAGKFNTSTNIYNVYSSKDGLTWESTNLNAQTPVTGYLKSLAWVFSKPSYIFTTVPGQDIHRYTVPHSEIVADPLLRIPWEYASQEELTDRITSYFDHAYPFIGYSFYQEPDQERYTTMNYLGIREYEPELYYSGHDGYDFSLPYGTEVLAAEKGSATYSYNAVGLGHFVRVEHDKGYQTTYAHLQNNPFSPENSKTVEKGEVIGLVGMSGNTSGPHLHFAVNTKIDGVFDNLIPDGKIDPFGWQNDFIPDYWENYSWLDTKGEHKGTYSPYLWEFALEEGFFYITPEVKEIKLKNKKVLISENSLNDNFSIFIEPYPQPYFPIQQNKLTYVTGTSALINAYNNLGQEIPSFVEPLKIEIDFSRANLDNILENSLNIYFWNENDQLWEKIPSILDLPNRIITGETTHFSKFAVLGEKLDAYPPITKISVSEDSFPEVELTANDIDYQSPVEKTLYSLDLGKTWNEYSVPFILEEPGAYEIWAKSLDSTGNWENTQKKIVNVKNVETTGFAARVKNSEFRL